MPSQSETGLVLCIQIDNEQPFYQPGDSIEGRVELTLNKEAIVGSIDVELCGQAKSKIVQSNGQAESVFQDKLRLFQTNLKLYDGHYKHKNSTFSWPFGFDVPETYAVFESKNPSLWRQKQQQEINGDQQSYPLPPSFDFEDSIVGKAWCASITYEITARMSHPDDRSVLGSPRPKTCVRTIRLRPKTNSNLVDFDDPSQRRGVSTSCTVRTLKLAPELDGSSSYLRRKAQSIFRSASLPRFTFEVDVSYPAMIQANHPGSIPFIVAVSPRTEAELTTICPTLLTFYRYPSVLLKRFTLVLEVSTQCYCPTIATNICASSSYDILLAKVCFNDLRLIMRSTSCDQKVGREEEAPTSVDLGRHCNVRITDDQKSGPDTKGKKDSGSIGLVQDQKAVTPSLETCIVARRYWFRWEVEFECAEEKVVLKGRSPNEVTILAPPSPREQSLSRNSDWIHPPSGGNDVDSQSNPGESSGDVLPTYSAIPIDDPSIESTPRRTCKAR